MGAPTYNATGIVLRKTKLGEADLIITLLAEDGSQIRVVAKGARKPQSMFSSRLELYSAVDVLCARGRNLDVVKEARLVSSNERLRRDMEHAASAAPIAELLEKVTQTGLTHPRLYPLTFSALQHMAFCDDRLAPVVTAAHLLKTMALCGFRPSLRECVGCGCSLSFAFQSAEGFESFSAQDRALSFAEPCCNEPSSVLGMARFSFIEGGAVCPSCRRIEAVDVPSAVIAWTDYLMMSTFDDLIRADMGLKAAFAVLELCRQWIHAHAGFRMKSLDFLFACGLFPLE